ncbi:MAG: ABC transporter substrate-binding protein [Anaerolineae bacterium]
MGVERLRRVLRRGLVIVCLLTFLAGCIDMSFLAPREPVTIRFVSFGDSGYFERLAEEFQRKNKYITVEFVGGRSMFFSQEPEYDVLLLNHQMMPYLMEQQPLLELNPLISEDEDFALDDFYHSPVEAMSFEGRRFGIPYMADMIVMYYNKDIFDRHNVPYPTVDWTWNDFLERALPLSDPAAGRFGFAYHQMGSMGSIEPMAMIYQHGGQLFDDLLDPSMITINAPQNERALQFYADLIHRHHVAPGPGERQIPFPDEGIEDGNYAMWMGYLSDEWEDLNVGVAPLPRGQQAMTFGSIIGFAISARSENPQASWEWIKFLSEQPPPGLMPARRSVAESDAMANILDSESLAAAQASLPNLASLPVNVQGELGEQWGIVMQALSGAIAAIQNGDPVGPALNAAQEKIDR